MLIMSRCFHSRKDCFRCVSVDLGMEAIEDVTELDKILTESVHRWRDDAVCGVWLRIPLNKSHYIAVCVNHKFDYHHAVPGHVVMQRWLPEDRPSTLPPYAFHYIAAAGLVVNDKNEILVMQERLTDHPCWKLPGGGCEKGEDIADAAIREVYEETGVMTELASLFAFRHMHQFRFGSSDIYFVCLMRPTTQEITFDPSEVRDARWMPIDEYLQLPDIYPTNWHIVQAYKDRLTNNHKYHILPKREGGHTIYTVAERVQTESINESLDVTDL